MDTSSLPTTLSREPAEPDEGMAARVRAFDWAKNELGPMDGWPAALRTAVDICLASRFPMFVWWGPRQINIYNDAYAPMLGQRHPAALGRPAREVWADIWPIVGVQAAAVLERGESTWSDRMPLAMERNGYPEVAYFTYSYSPIRDDSGRVGGMFCAVTEETARVRAEEALRLSEHRLLTVTQLLPAFVWTSDADGRMHFFNERWHEYTGLTLEQSRNSGWLAAIHPDDRDGYAAAWERTCRDQADHEAEVRYRRHDGAYRWYMVRATPSRDAGANVAGWIGTATDIHDRKLTAAALQQAQDRLRIAQQAAQSGTWDWDCATGEVTWTPEYYELYGLDPATTPASFENWLASVEEPDRPAVRQAAHKALTNPGRFYVEFRRQHPRLGLRWLAAIGQTTFDPAGRPLRMAGLALDITQRRQAEEAVRRGEERLQTVLDHLPVGVWFTDDAGTIVFGNPAGQRIWAGARTVGVERYGEYRGWWHETNRRLSADDWAMARALRHGTVSTGEIIDIQCFDGTRKTISNSAAPIRDAEGKIVGAVAINEDITERVRFVRALQESERRLRLALGSAPICVYANDADLRYTWIHNPRPGFTEEMMVGRRDDELHPPESVAELMALKREAIAGGRRVRRQIDTTIDGAAFCYDVTVEPQRDAGGKVIGIMAAVLDITGLARAQREAEAASQAKDQFIAVLSHELRTPLTPVLMASQLLEVDPGMPPKVRDTARMIRRNVELEARLIDDLLDLTRIRRGKLELHFADVSLHEKLRHVAQMCREEVEAKRQTLDVRLDADDPRVTADPARLQQVIWNLLRNAIKFTPEHGRVTLATEDDGDAVVLRVTDNGIGIAPEMLPRVFDAFEQGGRQITKQFGGLGLGLAISKAVVDLHGGSIVAASDGPGKGASFAVRLPVARGKPERPAGAGRQALRSGMACSLLLVEDHADTRMLLSMLLTDLGCAVTAAGTAAEAMAAFAASDFDLVLSDLGLPDLSGVDLVRKLKALKPRVPAVALSGYGMQEDVERSRAAGFDAHLTKPVNFDELEAVIRGLLRSIGV